MLCFKVLQKLTIDNSGAAIVCKRQKQPCRNSARNDNLIKAEGQIKSAADSDAVIKLNLKNREIVCNGQCIASQFLESPSGEFKYPFQVLII